VGPRIATHLGLLARELGFGVFQALYVELVFKRWLTSFDR